MDLTDGGDRGVVRLALARADTQLGKALIPELARLGIDVIELPAGTREALDDKAVATLMDGLKGQLGKHSKLDGFVYLLPPVAVDSLENPGLDEVWDQGMDLLREAFFFYRQATKLLAAQRHGCLLGVAFGIGLRGDASLLTASAVGEALAGLGQCVTQEVVKQGVRVNTLCYGFIAEAEYPEAVRANLIRFTELLDIPRAGRARDLAAAIKLLVSDDGSYINAKTIQLDGGLLA